MDTTPLETKNAIITSTVEVKIDPLKGTWPFSDHFFNTMQEGWEVIGNIYEHPELAEKNE